MPINPIRQVEQAQPPQEPYSPKPLIYIGFGSTLGLLLAAGIVYLREKTHNRVREPGVVRDLLNIPELGVVPSASLDLPQRGRLRMPLKLGLTLSTGNFRQWQFAEDGSLAAWHDRRSLLAESFRSIIASLTNDSHGRQRRVLLVASAHPCEGKTTVVANLGMALAESGRRVLLVDADFRRPRLHTILGQENGRGLSELLAGEEEPSPAEIAAAIIPTGITGLYVIPNGPRNENIFRLLHSPHLSALIGQLREQFDVVVMDAPPVLSLADARVVGPLTDGVLLVVRAGITDRQSMLEVHQRLAEDGIPVLGTVLNDWNPGRRKVERYYYSET